VGTIRSLSAVLSRLALVYLTTLTVPSAVASNSLKPVERPKYIPKPGDFTIVCTLFNHDRLPSDLKVRLPDIPITYDAHILVYARVEKVSRGKSPWPPGTALRFVIHSPSLMFGGYGFSGKQFSLTFSPFQPRTKDELIWFDPSMRYILRSIEKVEVAGIGVT
jgi:hypothetical protein